MKKFLLTFIISILIIGDAFARRCLEGAVFDVDENGQAQLVDCAKWERNPEAVLAEQKLLIIIPMKKLIFQMSLLKELNLMIRRFLESFKKGLYINFPA